MPDWDRYRKTFLLGDFSAQNLERLRTMRAWVDLSPEECAAAAEQRFAGMDAEALRPWYQLSRALSLKLANTASSSQTAVIAAIDQISSIIARLQPASTQLSAGMLAGNATWQEINPLSAAVMTVNVSPAYVNEAGLQKLKGLLGGLLQIANKAASDNTYRPTAFYFAAEAARALGDGNANRGDSAEAMEWYAKSGEYFDAANEPDRASKSRQKAAALELQVTGDIDRVMQRILGPLFDPAHPPALLDAAMAYADLSQLMQQARDGYGAGQQAARAAAAFEKLGFRDPETPGADIALDSWVSRSCDLAPGKPVFALLIRVCQAYSAVYSGRISQFSESAPERALKAQQLAAGMLAIVSQIVAETTAAEESVKVAIDDYFPTIAAPDPSAPNPTMSAEPPAEKEQEMAQIDQALTQLQELAGAKGDAGEPVQPVLAMFEQLKPLADALEMPLYSAKWQLAYCYAQLAAGDKEAALKAAEEAVSILLRGRPAKLSSLVQMERRPYLEALLWKMRLQMMLGRLQEGLATCLETIADFEESRGRVNAPLQQSSALESAIEFYRGAAFAAFKMQDWELLLRVTELVKARSALRSRRGAIAPDPEFQTLAKQFDQLTGALQSTSDPAALDDIKARRRDVFDLMTIARLRNSSSQSAPAVSVAALQQVLQPDEAVLNYFYLNATVFVIVRLDRERCEVERVLSSDEDLAPVNDLLDAIEGLDASGPLDLDSAIAAAGNIVLTPGVRQFLKGKRRVIISPHHRLHLFPFHVATWDGKFLIEHCAVRYVPNLSSLLMEWVGRTGKDVFALGVGQFSVARQNWGELKNTEEQVREVHRLYTSAGRGAITFTGAAANVEAFRALASSGRLAECSAVHLATHGTSVFSAEAQNEPMESTLVLENGCIDGLEIATLNLPAEVAVLSACNSGQRAVGGRGLVELPGDEIFGLQAALFQAGVHTVLGTLWPVETNAAYAVTLKFHEGYIRGDAVEIALQKAMVELCEANGRAGTFLWAPFFLSSLGTARTTSA
jgi:hypothetical protein